MPGLLSADETASMQVTVASGLDQSLPLLRKTVVKDGYGNNIETWVSQGNVTCNVFRPTGTHLQLFADIIGAQQAMMIRFLPGTDIREGDQVTYKNENWLVQVIQVQESYTIPNDALMTVVH
jgi:head-tail adaptor